jgi:RNA polymerase sigma-70 factor (ECF subfamily)
MLDDAIQKVLNGNTDIFAEIVREHHRMLLAYASFRLADRDLVDEVVQQTFIRAYEQLAEYQRGEDFSVWLRVLCKYCIMTELKRQRREQVAQKSHLAQLRKWTLERGAEKSDPSELKSFDELQQCLGRLPGTMRELVRLRYHEDLPVKEIARTLKQSITWVTTALFRVRGALRECLSRSVAE